MFFLESNGSRAMSPCRHVQLISPGSLNRSRNDSASGAAQVRPWMGMVLKSQEFDDVFESCVLCVRIEVLSPKNGGTNSSRVKVNWLDSCSHDTRHSRGLLVVKHSLYS